VTPLVPLVVDTGNGAVLLPVSSISRNPFLTIANLQELRHPNARRDIQKPREEWMRASLYAVFGGNRYECVKGNTLASVNRKGITDIDAAVFDQTTGTLGLFELNWQNLHVSDIRQMSSRASNLAEKLGEWAGKVKLWRAHLGDQKVAQALRLNTRDSNVRAVHLFAISQTATRVSGFGYNAGAPELAMANWAQFVRVKHEVAPSPDTIGDIHRALIEEYGAGLDITELPFAIEAAGISVMFENLWVGTTE
jgi:hypothetical protein